MTQEKNKLKHIKKDTNIVKIDVENLMKVLRGEPYETYKRKLQNFTYRF